MARREEFSFLSSNGKTKVHGVRWVPYDGNFRAILQISHGMCEHMGRYEEFASFVADYGFLVVGHDHVGHGDSIESKDDFGYFGKHPSDILVEDMHQVRKMTETNKPYFMMAHSMGSYMLRKYLSIHGDGLSGAIVMGTGYIPQPVILFGISIAKLQGCIMGTHHRSKLLRELSYSKPYKKFDSYGKDYTKSWLTKDIDEVKKDFSDKRCLFTFTCNGYLGLFEAISFCCKKKNAERIPKDIPIWLISGDDDPVGDLGEGVRKVERLYKSVGIKSVECKLYPGDRHEIIHEIDKDIVYRDIIAWLNSGIDKWCFLYDWVPRSYVSCEALSI